jgi:hypothetical protein
MIEKTTITQEMIATAVAVLAAHHVQCAAPLAEVAAKILAIGAKGPKVRSPADHRRFFGVIKAAFLHWPEKHEFQPEDPEHLRAWLLCRAGYKPRVRFRLVRRDTQSLGGAGGEPHT